MPNTTLKTTTLTDGEVAVTFLNYGAITRDWAIGSVPMVRRLARNEAYLNDPSYTGVIAGRVANRTANGRFEMDDQTYQLTQNDGKQHLHGGTRGLGQRFWQMETDGASALRLSYHSPDGEQGYPGAVDFCIDVSLQGHRLRYDMQATPDRPTPINMAQHNYYTLGGEGKIWGCTLQVAADRFTPANVEGIPTGEITTVKGTAFDFRSPRALGPSDGAMDHNLLFSKPRDTDEPAAQYAANGYALRMWSDQIGAQIYASGNLSDPNSALCIEPQAPPNAVNQRGFPCIIATPDRPYRQKLHVEIKAEHP